MDSLEKLKKIFPANTISYIYRRPKPFSRCIDLDDAYTEFEVMGFNAALIESRNNGASDGFGVESEEKESKYDYVLIVGDYLDSKKTKIILDKMAKMVDEKPIESKSELIENTLQKMGVDLSSMKIVNINDVNKSPNQARIEQNRDKFIFS